MRLSIRYWLRRWLVPELEPSPKRGPQSLRPYQVEVELAIGLLMAASRSVNKLEGLAGAGPDKWKLL